MATTFQQSQTHGAHISAPKSEKLWLQVFPERLGHKELKQRVFGRLKRHELDSPPAINACEIYTGACRGRAQGGIRRINEVVSFLFVLDRWPNGNPNLRAGVYSELIYEVQRHQSIQGAPPTVFDFGRWDFTGWSPRQRRQPQVDCVPSQPHWQHNNFVPQNRQQPSNFSMPAQQQPINGPSQTFNGAAGITPPNLNANATPFIPEPAWPSVQVYTDICNKVPTAPAAMKGQSSALRNPDAGIAAPTGPPRLFEKNLALLDAHNQKKSRASSDPMHKSSNHTSPAVGDPSRMSDGAAEDLVSSWINSTTEAFCKSTSKDDSNNENLDRSLGKAPAANAGSLIHQEKKGSSNNTTQLTQQYQRSVQENIRGFRHCPSPSDSEEEHDPYPAYKFESRAYRYETGKRLSRDPSLSFENDNSQPVDHTGATFQPSIWNAPWPKPKVHGQPGRFSKSITISSWNPITNWWETYETTTFRGFHTGRVYFRQRYDIKRFYFDTLNEDQEEAVVLDGSPAYHRNMLRLTSAEEPRSADGKLISDGRFGVIGDRSILYQQTEESDSNSQEQSDSS